VTRCNAKRQPKQHKQSSGFLIILLWAQKAPGVADLDSPGGTNVEAGERIGEIDGREPAGWNLDWQFLHPVDDGLGSACMAQRLCRGEEPLALKGVARPSGPATAIAAMGLLIGGEIIPCTPVFPLVSTLQKGIAL
jgi:hypothetical protein